MAREHTATRKAIESRADKAAPRGQVAVHGPACKDPNDPDLGSDGAKIENINLTPDVAGTEVAGP